MKLTPLKLYTSVAVSLLFPVVGMAMPTVSGNTINWPDDGWYQVQRADTFETVCEGSNSSAAGANGGACVIGSGNHIVINHTSGIRFENISAGGAASSTAPATANTGGSSHADVSSVRVEGNSILMPDDGWYQVQNAQTFESVCQGVLQCEVSAGTYIVINHTTGQRMDGITVGSGGSGNAQQSPVMADGNNGSAQQGGVSVDGNTIRWANDGWYQVQNANTFATICEGGTDCAVEPGNYIVINHTTGVRSNIEVAGGAQVGGGTQASSGQASGGQANGGNNATNGNSSVRAELDEDFGFIIFEMGGYSLETLGYSVEYLVDEMSAVVTPEDLVGKSIEFEGEQRALTKQSFACPLGGTVVREFGNFDTPINTTLDTLDLSFDQCIIPNTNNLLPDGNYQLNGDMQSSSASSSSSGGGGVERSIEWTDFTLARTGPDNLTFTVTGSVEGSNLRGGSTLTQTRNADIELYRRTLNGETTELRSVAFNLSHGDGAMVRFNQSLSVSGTTTGQGGNGASVSVRTTSPLERTFINPGFRFDGDDTMPLSGGLELVADSGAILSVSPSAAEPIDSDNMLLNLDYTDEVGNTSVMPQFSFGITSLPYWEENCPGECVSSPF